MEKERVPDNYIRLTLDTGIAFVLLPGSKEMSVLILRIRGDQVEEISKINRISIDVLLNYKRAFEYVETLVRNDLESKRAEN